MASLFCSLYRTSRNSERHEEAMRTSRHLVESGRDHRLQAPLVRYALWA